MIHLECMQILLTVRSIFVVVHVYQQKPLANIGSNAWLELQSFTC